MLDFVHTEINAFFVRLAPLQLTATELISLVNKQLIPVLTYRLMAGLVTDAQLYKVQQSIWHNVAQYGRLPHHLSQKDRHLGRPQGCFSLMPLQTFMRSQIFNYSMRYLNHDGPPQCSRYVSEALKARKANWLQNAFVDSVYALGGRFHGFGEWNPCPVEQLLPKERVHVEFTSGWFSGTVLTYSAPDSAALIKFDVHGTLFHIQDKRHNFTTQPQPQLCPVGPDPPKTPRTCPLTPASPSSPATPRRPLLLSAIETKEYGHLFRYPEEIEPPQVPALQSWGCSCIIQALSHPSAREWLWVYLDGSWDNPLSGSAVVLVWTDGTVLILSIPCPYFGSCDSEFWSFVQCVHLLESIQFRGKAFFCIHNSHFVDCVDWFLSGTVYPPPSASSEGTWQTVLCSLISETTFTIGAGWLKSHVGFPGNEVADRFTKYTAHACRLTLTHRQPPARYSVTFQKSPWHHKFSGAASEAVPRTPWPGYGIQPVSGPLTPCTACSVP